METGAFPEVQGLWMAPVRYPWLEGHLRKCHNHRAQALLPQLRCVRKRGAVKCHFRILKQPHSRIAAVLFLTGALTLNCLPQSTGKGPHTVTLKQGQVIETQLIHRLNSGRAQIGDEVVLKLSEPILAGGETVLPKGSIIQGRVSFVKRAAKNCHFGSIRWEADPLAVPGGGKIALRVAPPGEQSWRLAKIAQDDKDARARAQATTPKKGSAPGHALKTIAMVPVIAVALVTIVPLSFAADGYTECPNGSGRKGKEESFGKGKQFYAEVVDDVQISFP